MINHAQQRKSFTRIDNETIEDARLTFGARGLLALLLSKPKDWDIDLRWLESQSPGGKRVVRGLMDELVDLGYAMPNIDRRQISGQLGHSIASIHERPGRDLSSGPGRETRSGDEQGINTVTAGGNQGAKCTVQNAPQVTTERVTTELATTTPARRANVARLVADERSSLSWVQKPIAVRTETLTKIDGELAADFDAHLTATAGEDDAVIAHAFRAKQWPSDEDAAKPTPRRAANGVVPFRAQHPRRCETCHDFHAPYDPDFVCKPWEGEPVELDENASVSA